MKKIVQIIVVSTLAFLLLFGATAKEFVHLFAQHEDTIHDTKHHCPPGETHIDHEHHHCSFVNDALSPFFNDNFFIQAPNAKAIFFAKNSASFHSSYIPPFRCEYSLRGPPTNLS